MRKGTSAPAGHQRIDVPVAMGRLVFAPEIRGFLERYPKITIELGCADRAVDLVQKGVDCALRGGQLPDSRLSARRVGDLRFALCAAPHYIEQHGLPRTADDLARHHQLGCVLASTGKVRPVTLTREGRKLEFGVPARFQTTDGAAALSAGLDGPGIVVLAEFVASHYLTSGALMRVLPGWQCPLLPPHLVTRTTTRSARRTGACLHGLGARPVASAHVSATGTPLTRRRNQGGV